MLKKILIVFGTRPEAIKMAPLVNEFKQRNSKFETFVCVTGQHRQMLDQVLSLFKIKPDFDLNIMRPHQDLYDITTEILLGMREVLKIVNPNIVFVHGDTTTSTATALAAYYQQISVAHVEAGLRTGNMYSPFPEEMNRMIIGRIATFHFAPTPLSKLNLLNENVLEKNILITGNTVIDALKWVTNKIKTESIINKTLTKELKSMGYDTERIQNGQKLVLITGHRRENFGNGFYNICYAIKELSQKHPDVDFVYPVHLNPHVRKPVFEILTSELNNIFLIEPLQYLSFIFLMDKSYLILTDSGGIQEEAPGLGKPVLVMRNTTERPEAIEAGTVLLVGTDKKKIIDSVSELLNNSEKYDQMTIAKNPFGDGLASKQIVDAIEQLGMQ